ncbi:MAG: hypothetical protein ACLQDY_05515 [Streptosporangiaceae bacterium]
MAEHRRAACPCLDGGSSEAKPADGGTSGGSYRRTAADLLDDGLITPGLAAQDDGEGTSEDEMIEFQPGRE